MKIVWIAWFCLIAYNGYAQITFDNVPAPELKITQVANEVDLNSIGDRSIVLEFWATWCGGCIEAIPHINELAEKYKGEIVFISVNSHDSKDKLKKFLNKKTFKSVVAMDNDWFLKNELKVQAIPVTFIIDKNGMLRWRGYASQLTTELLDKYLKTNVILPPETDTINLQYSFLHSVDKRKVNVATKIEKVIYDQFQSSTKSLSMEFEENFLLHATNVPLNYIVKLLINPPGTTDAKEILFQGDSPIDYSINYKVESEEQGAKKPILYQSIEKLKELYDFSMDTVTLKVDVWDVTRKGRKLSKHQTPEDVETEIAMKDEKLHFNGMTMKEMAYYFSLMTQEKYYYGGDDQTRYSIVLNEVKDVAELKKIIKKKYGIKLKKDIKDIETIRVKY